MREITAIVLGASGLVGKELVLQLLNDQRFAKIRAITRTPLSVQHHKLEACLVNFDDEVSFRELMREGSVVFCALGTTMRKVKGDKQVYRRIDFEIPFKAASWGLENQVRRFVLVSAVGAGSGSANFYLRLKGELEDKIASMPFDAVAIMRPSLLLGERQETRPSEAFAKIIMKPLSLLFFGGLHKYRAIYAKDVATAMVESSVSVQKGVQIYTFKEMQALILNRHQPQ